MTMSHDISAKSIVDEYLLRFPESVNHRDQLLHLVQSMISNRPSYEIDQNFSDSLRLTILQKLVRTQAEKKNIDGQQSRMERITQTIQGSRRSAFGSGVALSSVCAAVIIVGLGYQVNHQPTRDTMSPGEGQETAMMMTQPIQSMGGGNNDAASSSRMTKDATVAEVLNNTEMMMADESAISSPSSIMLRPERTQPVKIILDDAIRTQFASGGSFSGARTSTHTPPPAVKSVLNPQSPYPISSVSRDEGEYSKTYDAKQESLSINQGGSRNDNSNREDEGSAVYPLDPEKIRSLINQQYPYDAESLAMIERRDGQGGWTQKNIPASSRMLQVRIPQTIDNKPLVHDYGEEVADQWMIDLKTSRVINATIDLRTWSQASGQGSRGSFDREELIARLTDQASQSFSIETCTIKTVHPVRIDTKENQSVKQGMRFFCEEDRQSIVISLEG